MQIIGVDIGNSAIKIGVPNSGDEVNRIRIADVDEQFHGELPSQPCFWSVCSVSQSEAETLKLWIEKHRPADRYYLLQADDVPLNSNVVNRQQVGRDRLVAAWLANQLCSIERGLVVIDAGTAVTIDLVDSAACFQGGVIFPGIGTNLKTLARATHDLPDLETGTAQVKQIMEDVIGKDTEMAILRGVFRSQLAAYEKISHDISATSPIIATGGVIELMKEFLPTHWHFEPLLVVRGAYEIGKTIHKKTDE